MRRLQPRVDDCSVIVNYLGQVVGFLQFNEELVTVSCSVILRPLLCLALQWLAPPSLIDLRA